MKTLIAVVSLAVCLLPLRAGADDASHQQAAKDLVTTMKMKTVFDESFQQLVDLQIRQQPQLAQFRQTMLDFFAKYMSWDSLEPEFVKLYAAKFSEDELNELSKFYKTPVGQKTLKVMPELMSEGAEIGQKRVQEHISELQQMIIEQSKKLNAPTTAPTTTPQ